MKSLRAAVHFCLILLVLPIFASSASASTLTLSGNILFSSLDGSAQDDDGQANSVFTVNGDLVIDGTINCNDDLPLAGGASACPIRVSASGDLILEAGSGIFAENRRNSGNGGNIRLEVGGDLTLRGPDGALPGAVVSTSRLTGTVGTAGSLTAEVAGAVDLQAGSVLAANSQGGSAGAITVTGETVLVAGLVASGPSRTVLAGALTGKALDAGNSGQTGGTIHLRALGSTEPGLRIEPEGIVVSQGEGGGGRLVLLEACGIEVRGLVASLSKNNGPSQVVLRSGRGILVDGRDLGSATPAEGRFGRIRADGTQQGAAGYLVDLFAESDIQVFGPDPGATGLFAASSTPGTQPLRYAGGTITAISLSGALTASGNAFETGRTVNGDKGGAIDLQALGDVTLDGATVRAVGDFTSTSNARAGGHIDVRSFQGAVSWTFGVGDVRPTGTGIAAARRGTIEITACSTVDTTGSQFPVNGSAVPPFPVKNEGVCSPAAPSLPSGEPPLPQCEEAPMVVSTSPADGAVNQPANTDLTVTFSEAVNVSGNWFQIVCETSGTRNVADTLVTGGPTIFTINPNADFDSAESCTVTIEKTLVSDQDTNDPPDNMVADHVFSFTVEAAPSVTATTPTGGATGVASNANVTVTFSENVDVTGNWFQISCATSGTHNPSNTAVSGGPLTFTLDPNSDFAAEESCTATVFAAQVADQDTNDPPDNMPADHVFSFTVEAAPSVTATTPAGGATGVASNANVTITFSENVDVTGNWFQIDCPSGMLTPANTAVSGGPLTFTLDPNSDFAEGESCTVTVFAAQVSDQDTNDPPDNMAADHVFSFTIDAAPSVISTVPTNGATGVSPSATITVNFSENVSATGSSFAIECPVGSARAFTLSSSPASSFTLTPTVNLPAGAVCQVTVFAAQISDTDAGDPPNNMAANHVFSFSVPPVAVNDAYPHSVIGNVSVDSSVIPYAVTANDSFASPVTITAFDATTAAGGQVVMVTSGVNTGHLTYNPPAGYEGADSFTYTISNAAGSATATVNLTVSGMIWFINNAGGLGDGRLSSPFNSLSAFHAVNNGIGNNPAAGDNIFMYQSVSSYSGPLTLLNNQRLIGQDSSSTLLALTGLTPGASSAPLPPVSSADATIVSINSASSGIALASGNSIYGLTVGSTGSTAISGSGFGTLTTGDVRINTGNVGLSLANGTLSGNFASITSTGGANNVSLTSVDGTSNLGSGALSGATSDAFVINGGTASFTYSGTIDNTTANPVDIQNKTGGTVTLSGAISGTAQGILLHNNTGATVNFSGTLTLSSGTQTAFNATGGGTVTATDIASTLASTTGTALNVVNTTIGASGLKFQSISANGAASGIMLNNTGSSGGLSVLGTGAANSGGTIQNTTSHGVTLTRTLSPSFTRMRIQSTVGSGVKGTQVTNFTFTNGTIDNSGTGLGAETSNIAFNDTTAGTENNLSGMVTITGNMLTNAYYHGVDIFNFNGTIADATISNNTITSTSSTATSKGSGIRLVAFGSATTVANVTRATIANNIISNFPSANGILATGGNGNAAGPAGIFGTAGNATSVIAITGNRVAGFSPAVKIGAFAIAATVNGKGQGNFDISNNGTVANPLTNMIGAAITNSAFGQAVVTSNINNNVIVANNQAGAQGIGAGTSQTFGATDMPSLTVTISNNNISQTDGNGILVTARDATGTVRAKIQNNTVAAPLSGNRNGIRVDAGNAVSINDSVCLNISGNTSAGVGLSPEGIGLRKQGTVAATNNFALHGLATSPANQAQAAAHVTSQNPGSASGTLIISGDNFNSPTCSFP